MLHKDFQQQVLDYGAPTNFGVQLLLDCKGTANYQLVIFGSALKIQNTCNSTGGDSVRKANTKGLQGSVVLKIKFIKKKFEPHFSTCLFYWVFSIKYYT